LVTNLVTDLVTDLVTRETDGKVSKAMVYHHTTEIADQVRNDGGRYCSMWILCKALRRNVAEKYSPFIVVRARGTADAHYANAHQM